MANKNGNKDRNQNLDVPECIPRTVRLAATVEHGFGSMPDLRKAGRAGTKTLVYLQRILESVGTRFGPPVIKDAER